MDIINENVIYEVIFDKPIKINHYGPVFANDGKILDFEGSFRGNFSGASGGIFIGAAILNEYSDISKSLYNDVFIQALVKDYFYKHFIEWITLNNES